MHDAYKRFVKLMLGLALYALGIVLTLKAHIGYGPWEVFHVGLSQTTGMSIGSASIITGLVIAIIALLFGEKFGMGTILNMVLIGIFLDILLAMSIIPVAGSFWLAVLMMVGGLFVISLGSYFYIGSGFGAGPRDSLMVALTRKTRLPVGLIRGGIELCAVLAGWRLGGMVGVGTVLAALLIGFCVQITFRLLRFDPTSVKHDSLATTWRALRRKPGLIAGGVLATLALAVLFLYFMPTGAPEAPPAYYRPVRDDGLAARYAPDIFCSPEFGSLLALYYRAAVDERTALVHIAYHPLWRYERNDAQGPMPFLSRTLYTGGLSLQRLMFGKGDVESLALTVDPLSGAVVALEYETARDYDPAAFSVTHEPLREEGVFSAPLSFEVISWNHLFRRVNASGSAAAVLPVQYFTDKAWREYRMVKNPRTRIQKDRAHFVWERVSAEER